MKIEDNIKKAFQNWDENASEISFDKEKVWENIQPKRKKTFLLFYPAAAAIILLCLGISGYLYHSNQQLKKQYQANLLKLEQRQQVETKVVVKKEIETKYETKVREVVKESPELQQKIKVLEEQLSRIQQERENINQQFHDAISRVKSLQDTISFLKAKEPMPLFTENRGTAEKQSNNEEIRVNINEKALADLPVSKAVEQKKDKIKIKLGEDKKEKSQNSVPLFSSLSLKQ